MDRELTRQKLHKQNFQTWQLLVTNTDFKRRVESIQTDLADTPSERSIIELQRVVLMLIEEFSVPIRFSLALSKHLQKQEASEEDIPTFNYHIKPIPLRGRIQSETGKRCRSVQIEVFGQLSSEEFKLLRQDVETWYPHCFGDAVGLKRSKLRPSLERDIEIEELAKHVDGKNYTYADVVVNASMSSDDKARLDDIEVAKQVPSRLSKERKERFALNNFFTHKIFKQFTDLIEKLRR